MEKIKSKKNEKTIKKISENLIEKKISIKKPEINLENEVLVERLTWFYQKKKEDKSSDKQEERKKDQKINVERKDEKRDEKKEELPDKKESEKKEKRAFTRFLDESSEFHTEFEPTKASSPVLKSPEPSRDSKPVKDMEQFLSTVPAEKKEEKTDSGKLYDAVSDPKYYTEAYSDPSDLYEEKKSVSWGEEQVLQETRANMRPARVRMVEEQMPHETRGGAMREGIKYDLHHQEEKHSVGFVPEFTKYNKEKRRKT